MTDRSYQRQHPRKRVIEPAQLQVRGYAQDYFCMIRDLSEGGARLRIPPELPVEGEMALIANRLGLQRKVRVVWRDHHSAGIAFI